MKWYKGIKRRILKKYVKDSANHRTQENFKYLIFHDGACYTLQKWEALLNQVAALKPGDKIWNCYSQSWDVVKEIEFIVAPMKRGWKKKRGVGEVVQEFTVITVSGYYLCDETMFDPDYWK